MERDSTTGATTIRRSRILPNYALPPLGLGWHTQPWRTQLVGTALCVLVFSAALAVRLIGLGGAVTEDEDQWIGRAGNFARAVSAGDWTRTFQTGHPGITVMWLATLAAGPDRAIGFGSPARGNQLVTEVPGFLATLAVARVPFSVINAALAVLIGLLGCRVVGVGPGLCGAVLLALDPYLAGVGPIVGLDGLLAGLLTASLLALVLAMEGVRPSPGWVALSGLLWGLGALTKTSALLLLPALAGLALFWGWRKGARRHWMPLVMGGAIWFAAAGLAILALWPAMWGQPGATLLRTLEFSARLGGSPHGPGNFLLGQPVEDPGPFFYPVALALRLGPATTLGLMALVTFGIPRPRRAAWMLLACAASFILLLAASPKKVDRYLLPILPMLDLVAGVGWWALAQWLVRRFGWSLLPSRALASVVALAIVVGAVQLWPLLTVGRYPLAAYNPLFGGAPAAERAIPVGWGEGLDDVGAELRQLAGGSAVTTAIWYPLWVNFQPHAPGRVVPDRQIAEAEYFVDYVHARQRRHTPRQLLARTPDAVVRIAGVDYARIYRLR